MSKNKTAARPVSFARFSLPLSLTLSLPQLLRAEDQVDYRYEYYKEDNNRMTIQTHSVYFEQKATDAITAKGELVYDGISGATPTGTHNWTQVSPGVWKQGKIKTTAVEDIRRSLSLQLDGRLGNNTITPGFAYSQESDYESYGVSLNDAIDFNEKNTTFQYGVSQNFDNVRHANKVTWSKKYSTEGMVGITQLLSPKTTLNATFTFGNDSGYLSDPYRLAEFIPAFNGTSPGFGIGVAERRPAHRNKEIVYTSLTHYFDKVNASLEGSYRFYNDSYGVVANTVGLSWHQWLGKHFIAEPFIRLYEQSAASFYTTGFSGDINTVKNNSVPGMHSSDYRLSEFYSTDIGIQATAVINDHIHVVVGYHRYEMHGMDGQTSAAMYPKANVYTVGISFLW
jgi:hypothetical protein